MTALWGRPMQRCLFEKIAAVLFRVLLSLGLSQLSLSSSLVFAVFVALVVILFLGSLGLWSRFCLYMVLV